MQWKPAVLILFRDLTPWFSVVAACIFWFTLTGCGALSTHQSPKLLSHQEKAITGGLGVGSLASCEDDTSGQSFGNGCVLTLDPYFGWRYGYHASDTDTKDLGHGFEGSELGIKFSGVPFLGGTLLADYRLQQISHPVYLTWDFGISVFPCLTGDFFDDDDVPDEVDQNRSHKCVEPYYAGGFYAGVTFGKEWLFAGAKYSIAGTSWDGLQLIPGINVGSALGTKRFKLIPSVDVYFYQWPMDASPELRIIYGIGFQSSY